MKEDKLVSIILQTRNRRDLLPKALESAENQTYKNIEILVGDNCSEDETESYMLDMVSKDPRIKYFRWNENIGVFKNATKLLEKVSGDYFLFLNDDDWLDNDYIEKCLNFFDEHEGYAFVTPSIILYKENYQVFKECFLPDLTSEKIEERIKSLLRHTWRSFVVTGVFKTDVLTEMQKKDGYIFKNRTVEDIVFMIRALAIGKGKLLPDVHYNKLNNGKTSVLAEIPKDYFDMTGVTGKNFLYRCLSIFCSVIYKENLFKNKINNRLQYIIELEHYLKKTWRISLKIKIQRVLKFLKIYNEVFA